MNTIRNSVRLIGRVGNAPEVKTFDNGNKVASFPLATNEYFYNDKGEKQEQTQWHSIVAWGKNAEVVERFAEKGKELAVAGRINYNSYQDKDGVKRTNTEIVINELLLL
ncbi:single-stranded DNA-binding protein [Capnocytophaga sp. ARDL2]|uniref:single-stranded DNA-binding protein n=1 Tax=Capnocytophaga sp. ARDL2 TaxID=3238809 RepID=UPI00355870ED